MAASAPYRHHWLFYLAAVGGWLSVGWVPLEAFQAGTTLHSQPVTLIWFGWFALFGLSLVGAIASARTPRLHWAWLTLQASSVAVIAYMVPNATFATLLVITAWQVAMATTPGRALSWVFVQTAATVAALAHGQPNFEYCYILGLCLALQLFFVFTASTLRSEAATARALAKANHDLRAAQSLIAGNVRTAERMRISRELHDAWGHELTALGLQLEIASHTVEDGSARRNIAEAKTLSRALLAKVRDVVSALREAERCDLRAALDTLAQSVPSPAVHVAIAPDLRVSADQSHALLRCAQEALTNSIKHADARNLWLDISSHGDGIRFVAQDDGQAQSVIASSGSGLLGMRERLEHLGGRLMVKADDGAGFTIDAWLPLQAKPA